MGSSLRFVIGNTHWTRALFDGTVKVDGFQIEYPEGWDLTDRLYGVREGRYDGGDPAITDIVRDKANGGGESTLMLPVFLVSGFRHRTLIMRRDGVAPAELAGHTVCIPRVLTPGGVWLRGMLQDELGVRRDQVEWVTVHSIENDADWPYVRRRLDYPEGIEGVRVAVQMVKSGEFDAIVHPGVHEAHSLFGGDYMVEPVLRDNPDLWSPLGDPETIVAGFKRSQVYPLVHALTLRTQVVEENPGLVDALMDAFGKARERA
jgi:4,5-dihydroxyphthalate decarboxylase